MNAHRPTFIDYIRKSANGNGVPSEALTAALAAVAAAGDDGYVLLPQNPTHEMIEAARSVSDLPASEIIRIWDAMLQAW